ncbi:MAG: type II/IV secretion system ATPase subunit, partial [Nitrososphaeria archaeon]|nr:type II/IV secretion system ATPase subunit [Nitrososphaeria archaeon]
LYVMPPEAIRDADAFARYASVEDEVLMYYLKREFLGYGAYDVLMNDENIEDIISWPGETSCVHKDFGTLKVNIALNEEEFERHVEKFVHMAGKSVSLYSPIISVRLPTNDRLSVTYAREVSSRPSFAIRKFPKRPWSITAIMLMGTLTPEMAAYLMMMVKYRKPVLICGPVGSGKTSLINALCSLIPAEEVVVTVEDTPELRLARRNWISLITRESMTVDEKGEINMFDLVRHALRQPAHHIIVGEVRGEEGRIWAQAVATGHGGITSLHAETPEGALERLKSDPINVSEGALASLSTIVTVKSVRLERAEAFASARERIQARRVVGIYDIRPSTGIPPRRWCEAIFKYEPQADSFSTVGNPLESKAVTDIAESVPLQALVEEYQLYTAFLRRLKDLAPSNPSFGSHVTVTELVQELYKTGRMPAQLGAAPLIRQREGL